MNASQVINDIRLVSILGQVASITKHQGFKTSTIMMKLVLLAILCVVVKATSYGGNVVVRPCDDDEWYDQQHWQYDSSTGSIFLFHLFLFFLKYDF